MRPKTAITTAGTTVEEELSDPVVPAGAPVEVDSVVEPQPVESDPDAGLNNFIS